MRAAQWWGGWLVTMLAGYVVLPVALALLYGQLGAAPGCDTRGFAGCAEDQALLVLIGWGFVLPLVLAGTLFVLAVLWQAMPRQLPPAAPWRITLVASRCVVLAGPAVAGLVLLRVAA
ncbi:hypothetical protein [Mumia zhuanghuii]|uniref:Transmembrane protein n=1 Tax=Mumia zhuanghuii TaxID=2585211 RepID=A0A5C4N0N7_9ACTN|nr:hypothetical protein [Mumia zhuanghuii]TNC51742.1 hypothetical protein FHE65_01140 [Mumia zhuanghuii]TNC52146.1 hypothetical protein FHE65_00790 [Mumia zhuanghuii]